MIFKCVCMFSKSTFLVIMGLEHICICGNAERYKMFKETIINILGEIREDIVSIKQDQDKRDQKQQK